MYVNFKELNNRLNKLTPTDIGIQFSEWLPCRSQVFVSQSIIEHTVSIDRVEVIDKTDAEVKTLILKRTCDTLICALNAIEKQLKELGE